MQAFVYDKGQLTIKEMPDPEITEDHEVIVALKYAGLNRRDLYIPDRVGPNKEALILGSDGAGIVEAVGSKVTNVSVGDEVIINPSLRWYQNSAAPPAGFEVLGMPDHGTLAEKIVISAEQLEKKPAYLTWEESGVLALAALTAYRALVTKGNLQKGETVFIPGAGSGVATYLIPFAKKIGAKVIVTSRSEMKQKAALELGADLAIATQSDWMDELASEQIDLVIESVGRATFNRSLNVLKPGGRIVVFGATTEDVVDLNLRNFFYGQYQLFGSTMGSREELRDMLAFMEQHQLRPKIDSVYHFTDTMDALNYLQENQQFGKIAIAINP